MTTTPKLLLAFLLVGLLFWSCNDDEVCKDCSSAIQHMCDKIKQNACDPDFMENAVNRLREDCGTAAGNVLAGYMAHTCRYETVLDCGSCVESEGLVSTSHLSVAKVPYVVRNHVNIPDTLTIILTEDQPRGNLLDITSNVIAGQDLFWQASGAQFNNTLVYVEVYRYDPNNTFDGTGELLAQESETFRLGRPGKWLADRIIDVEYDFLEGKYKVEFTNW